ncbi:CDP-alcohol phosphatidyltransferase family protein [Actinocorallia sp. API 0066]|uniref:CDP-alcohol phosphatidyltransferase family protein n=1 Tax=Actinocorallia sp. API 0066 TaxID=2896846 RepID=UPI001E605510|nr:CDP-alcohol phosphatidyltransferase family protein [Actinocorallia sp. API 0066]MCD0453757.1 CDP-alcohol phosphatidyltransferase family protein [Actinocorallia sp. API 0066]
MPAKSYSLKEIREKGQPPGLKERRNEEHWAGRLYGRALSPYLTWLLLKLGLSPNQMTYLMILCGIGAGVVFASGTGIVSALIGVVLIQLYLLLDCSDGEAARVTGRTSVTGIYLDRLGHYFSEVAVLVGLGFRAQAQVGGFWAQGGWVTLGVVAALGAALIKAETDNVVVARAKSGLPADPPGGDRALRPTSTWLALARQAASLLKFHRIIGAIELSLLILIAAVLDRILDLPELPRGFVSYTSGGWWGQAQAPTPEQLDAYQSLLTVTFDGTFWSVTRGLTVAVAAVAVLQTLLHFVSIVASRRLK